MSGERMDQPDWEGPPLRLHAADPCEDLLRRVAEALERLLAHNDGLLDGAVSQGAYTPEAARFLRSTGAYSNARSILAEVQSRIGEARP